MKYLVFTLLLLSAFACKSPQKIQISSATVRIVERQVRDTILPGFTVKAELSVPELVDRRIYDTLRIIDPRTKGELLLWKNKYGELVAECNGQDQTITKLQEKVQEFESLEQQTVIEVDPRSWWQKLVDFVPWYAYLIAGFLLGLMLRFRLL